MGIIFCGLYLIKSTKISAVLISVDFKCPSILKYIKEIKETKKWLRINQILQRYYYYHCAGGGKQMADESQFS